MLESDLLFFLPNLKSEIGFQKSGNGLRGMRSPCSTFQNDITEFKCVFKSTGKTKHGFFKKRLYSVLLYPKGLLGH